ncbi:GntP family permease [Fictibacillus aquaticus]|uniref:Transporter n=1 Tax=Fictibacillus aquaticus TaxID=2021314 RepID=A0A235FBD1_9BACL|nr:GntP family permease [Fictibacillus aquaticus]OYD58660.1 transporter [Fictibacillus aquaticus]
MTGIFLGLLLLMIFAYLGWSIIWIAPLCAAIVAMFGGLDLLPAYTETYMKGLVDFVLKWFPVFLFGAVFGKLMEDTGSARSVAFKLTNWIGTKRALLGVIAGAAVLTYGGVSLFVVVFAMYPLAIALFREANISRRLIPGAITLGAFTFTMTSLPGTPQIQNLIPIDYFKTSPGAGPIMGITAALIMAVGGYFYLKWRETRLTAGGEEYSEPDKGHKVEDVDPESLPNPYLSFLPLVVVVVTLNALKWNILTSLLAGILLILVLNWQHYKKFVKSINDGAAGSVMAILNTSAAVGFGAVVTAVPAFAVLTGWILGIKGNPLISEAIAVDILAGITGSASGGMGIALEALGQKYYSIAQSSGISPEAFHRIAAIASGASILPHNGALLTLLAVTGLTHKESYLDVAVVALVIPTIALAAALVLGNLGIY